MRTKCFYGQSRALTSEPQRGRFVEWGPRVTQLLDPARSTVVLCRRGRRSQQARAQTRRALPGHE
jgi:rhodanese-related sulfurtransferase